MPLTFVDQLVFDLTYQRIIFSVEIGNLGLYKVLERGSSEQTDYRIKSMHVYRHYIKYMHNCVLTILEGFKQWHASPGYAAVRFLFCFY